MKRLNGIQYTPQDVERILEIDRHKLFYWMKTHRLFSAAESSEARGSKNIFSFKNLVEIGLVKELLRFGLDLDSIKSIKDQIEGLDQSKFLDALVKEIEQYEGYVDQKLNISAKRINVVRIGKKYVVHEIEENVIEADGPEGPPYFSPSKRYVKKEIGKKSDTGYVSLQLSIGELAYSIYGKIG